MYEGLRKYEREAQARRTSRKQGEGLKDCAAAEECRRKCLQRNNKEVQILHREHSLTNRVQWGHRKGLGTRDRSGTWNGMRKGFGRSRGT